MAIVRTIHNKENPYVMLHKETIWNSGLSLAALGLWTRCMSNKDHWTFSIAGARALFKEGRNTLYKLINELIEAGYAIRGQRATAGDGTSKAGKRKVFSHVEYVIFEYKISPEEKAQYESEFQKSFPLPSFPHTEKRTLISNTSFPYTSVPCSKEDKEPPPPPSAPEQVAIAPSSSAVASEISSLLLEKVKETKPDIKLKKVEDWPKEVDRMMRLDGRNENQIREIIKWLPTSEFWRKNILCAASLRRHFDKLELSKNDTRSHETINRKLVNQALADIPDLYREVEPKYAYVSLPGVGKELYYANHDPDTFKELFCQYLDLNLQESSDV
jgi:hypothetical protein